MNKLIKILDKYQNREYSNNFGIGGGLDRSKFASNRHEDALSDPGKLTLGKTVQLFKKATGLNTFEVHNIISVAYDKNDLEWHHAGKLPKSYGGGMKKTYFFNAKQISDLAFNWETYKEELAYNKRMQILEDKLYLKKLKQEQQFLKKWATYFSRVRITPKYTHIIIREMQGKYGWFDSSDKDYTLTEYYSGYEFRSKKKLYEYKKLFK